MQDRVRKVLSSMQKTYLLNKETDMRLKTHNFSIDICSPSYHGHLARDIVPMIGTMGKMPMVLWRLIYG